MHIRVTLESGSGLKMHEMMFPVAGPEPQSVVFLEPAIDHAAGIKLYGYTLNMDWVTLTPEMTDAEKAKLEAMYEEFERRLAEDGGEWPEHTGPGR